MVTINEVAKKAGVSIATVSNVLNGRADKMSKETFSRVQTAIEGLGYQPSRAAQQLKTGCSQLLGLLVPSIGNPSYAVLAREIQVQLLGGMQGREGILLPQQGLHRRGRGTGPARGGGIPAAGGIQVAQAPLKC